MLSRPPLSEGVSFVVRVRDEEKTLAEALRSMVCVRIPHEVVVVLDRCADDSARIAAEVAREYAPNVRIRERTIPTSRAGVETLATCRSSARSLPSAVEDAFSTARYRWRFHAGADFVLSDELIAYLDSGALFDLAGPTRVRLPAVTPEDGLRNAECYLSNCLLGFGKHVFWEVPLFEPGAREVALDLPIHHRSTLAELKAYWNEPSWFESESDAEALEVRERYRTIVEIAGEPPRGLARGSNPACAPYYSALLRAEPSLSARGIRFYT